MVLFRNIFRNFAPRFPEKNDETKRREVYSNVSSGFFCVLIAHIRGFAAAVSDDSRRTRNRRPQIQKIDLSLIRGTFARIFSISEAVKARNVCVRMLSGMSAAGNTLAAVSSSGASKMHTWSYWPSVQYISLMLTPLDRTWAAHSATRCVVSLAAWMPLSVNCTKLMYVGMTLLLYVSLESVFGPDEIELSLWIRTLSVKRRG